MRINAELFLLDNALMNALTLLLSSALSGLRTRRWYAVAGLSMLGAAYAMLALGYWRWLLGWPFRLGFGLVLALGLRFSGWRGYLRAGGCTLLAALLLGGLALALSVAAGAGVRGGALVGTLPLRAALWTAALAALLPRLLRALAARRWEGAARARLRVTLDGVEREYRALVDTGNLVTEPLSGLPVALLPGEPLPGGLPVPCAGIAGETLLFARRPARACVRANGGWEEVDVMVAHTPAAFPEGVEAILPGAALLAARAPGKDGWRKPWGYRL